MNTYKRHRFPSDIISFYYRFNLSHPDIEDLLAERGIVDTHIETHIANLRGLLALRSDELIESSDKQTTLSGGQ